MRPTVINAGIITHRGTSCPVKRKFDWCYHCSRLDKSHRYHLSDDGPGAGVGIPNSFDIPMVLATGKTSDWSPGLSCYLTLGTAYLTKLEHMRRCNPRVYSTHVLSVHEGMRAVDIAKITGTAPGTIRMRLSRSRKMLQAVVS